MFKLNSDIRIRSELIDYYGYILGKLKTEEYNFVHCPKVEYSVVHNLLVSFTTLDSYRFYCKPEIAQTLNVVETTTPEMLLNLTIWSVLCVLTIFILCAIIMGVTIIVYVKILSAVVTFIVSFFQKILCLVWTFMSVCSMFFTLGLWGMGRVCFAVITNLPTFFTKPKTFLVPYFNALSCKLVGLRDSIQADSTLVFCASVKTVKTVVLKLFNSPLVCAIALFSNIRKFVVGFIDTVLYPYSLEYLWFDLCRSIEAFVDGSSIYIECFLDGICYLMEFLLRDGPAYLWGLVVYAPVCLLVDAPVCLADSLASAPECSVRFHTSNLWASQRNIMLDHCANSSWVWENHPHMLPQQYRKLQILQWTRYIYLNPMVSENPCLLISPHVRVDPYVWVDPQLKVFFSFSF